MCLCVIGWVLRVVGYYLSIVGADGDATGCCCDVDLLAISIIGGHGVLCGWGN